MEHRARFAAVAAAARISMVAALNKGADELVDAERVTCPVNDLEQHPGALRESIHKTEGDSELQIIVVADAVDAKGQQFGYHVEVGHGSQDGKRVPAHPWWFPTWRLMRARILSRNKRAAVAAARGEISDGG